MKKTYITPETDLTLLEPIHILAATVTKTTHAEWGAEGDYAPSIWVNEGHTPSTVIGSFPSVATDPEEGDWASRANGGIWE